jgi:enamine deaminase RidA (YjgF/YER057c/UK114 family)
VRGDGTRLPASTLVIVAGFTRPEFKVEVEVTAARLAAGLRPMIYG